MADVSTPEIDEKIKLEVKGKLEELTRQNAKRYGSVYNPKGLTLEDLKKAQSEAAEKKPQEEAPPPRVQPTKP